MNVDASVHSDSSSFSVKMVLRDHVGTFFRGKTLRFGNVVLVFEAEAIGVNEALAWIITLKIQNVIVESDLLLSIQAIEKGKQNYLEVGYVVDSCRVRLNQRRDYCQAYQKASEQICPFDG